MTQEYTEVEVREQCIAVMGPELGHLYSVLSNECTWLHWRWSEFKTLFGNKPKRIDLMNEAAPTFFALVQNSFWDNTLLHICRLADPLKSYGKDNLTLSRLPHLVKQEFSSEIGGVVDEAKQKSRFAREWRNSHISHQDLHLALGRRAEALPAATRQQVQDALDSIAAALNAVHHKYADVSVGYSFIPIYNGAETMLGLLRDGLKANVDFQARLEAGEPWPDDFEEQDPI